MNNTIELWQKRLEQQKSSGLNIREWCRQNHIAEKTYYKWRKAVSVSDTPDSNSVEFVPLNLHGQENFPKSAGESKSERNP